MDVAKQVLVTQTSWENGAFKIRFDVGKMNIGNTYQTDSGYAINSTFYPSD
jgi:hypothetical protein